MSASRFSKVFESFLMYGLRPPLSIEIDGASFRELKEDLRCIASALDTDVDLPSNQVMFHGVLIIGKLCTCGAHPEDWE